MLCTMYDSAAHKQEQYMETYFILFPRGFVEQRPR